MPATTARRTYAPSAAQAAFITTLVAEITALGPQHAAQADQLAAQARTDARGGIDALLRYKRTNRAAAAPVAPAAHRAPVQLVDAGMYVDGQTIYKVTEGRSGRRFAEQLVSTGAGWKFAYAKGAIFRLTEAMRMSAEQAAEFGAEHGWCCNCARELTHPASIKVGYGPTCAQRNGWPHSY